VIAHGIAAVRTTRADATKISRGAASKANQRSATLALHLPAAAATTVAAPTVAAPGRAIVAEAKTTRVKAAVKVKTSRAASAADRAHKAMGRARAANAVEVAADEVEVEAASLKRTP